MSSDRPANRLAAKRRPTCCSTRTTRSTGIRGARRRSRRRAREDKPIFLSIGYSACHWCHVMERESFEDAEIAALHERATSSRSRSTARSGPTSTRSTCSAVQTMTGPRRLADDGVPHARRRAVLRRHVLPAAPIATGMPGFRRVLEARRARPGATRREEIRERGRGDRTSARRRPSASAGERRRRAERSLDAAAARARGRSSTARTAASAARRSSRSRWRSSSCCASLARSDDAATARRSCVTTLRTMARGGIYDQLGGGFHRYSVDARWLVPHFEKMLYDNALLARALPRTPGRRPATPSSARVARRDARLRRCAR